MRTLIYKYITTSDLKRLDYRELDKIMQDYEILVLDMDIRELKKEIRENRPLAILYEKFLVSNKAIILNQTSDLITNLEKYLKLNKIEAKKILVISNKIS